ncbi:putative ankyrin repeat protein [Rosellinia necatrix]|uniref:Putative ankyrin repeat protein n=1 Tax=Rosellinia necatrix TaxID=77044 RepID=A0A1S8ACN4_ROSNE|nr:putative ankyrin repeat protein [Rosellinia necatrix]
MRTFCHRIPSPRRDAPEKKEEKVLTVLSEDPLELSTKSSQEDDASVSRNASDVQDKSTPKPETKKKSKAEQIAERHPKKAKRAKGPPGNPPQRQDSATSGASGKLSLSLPWDTPRHAASHGKIVLFMPFLHFETDAKRHQMSETIRRVRDRRQLIGAPTRDSLLIEAYLNGTPPLHPRRTLDQFFYHGIDTSDRDIDQVVYRFCKRHEIEKKVFMVDQLWLWVLGKDLVITCFPQRWGQPKNDPLNVLDGIIEETNAKTRPPIQSVYDLAMLIASRCAGMFDHSRLDNQDYQFLDMFESSIGVVTDRESRLFSRFNRASAQSARWLQRHRRRRRSRSTIRSRDTDDKSTDRDSADRFPDALLDIGVETSLLAEIKDIRDELNIIMGILAAQVDTVINLEGFVTEELRGEGSRRTTDTVVSEIRRRAGEQRRALDSKQKDVSRMDKQAMSLYDSLTDLLDLKQKHSNALEARFAGDHAVIAAKQGQTIMVFTIVTIVFLPLSFIASFFAINFVEWGDRIELTIPYVSRYLFGIGFAISIPLVALAFTVRDISDGAINLFSQARGTFGLGRRRDDDDNDDDDARPDQGLPATRREKFELRKPSLSSRREDYYQPPPSRPEDWDIHQGGGGGGAKVAWMRPSYHSRERSNEEYRGRAGRLSPPVSPAAARRRRPSLGSGNNGNNVTWAAVRPSFERGAVASQDLESGRFR